MYRCFLNLFFLLCPVLLFAQAGNPDLIIETDDLRIEQRTDGGFHLYIRKKPGIESVLLTETTRDPSLRAANYAYRAPEWNPVNGDEIRILDGQPIPKSSRIWSLIDSSPEPHKELGQAFHIFIPYILNYGYENSRHGEVYVIDGTYLNIRAFSRPYADYRGRFRDNPFILKVTEQQPQPGPPEGNYMKEAVAAFTDISSAGKGSVVHSAGPSDTVNKIKDILEREKGSTMDIVICLDTTGSMKNDFVELRKDLVPMLGEILGGTSCRIGIVFFKDYSEEYLTRVIPFTTELNQIQKTIDGVVPRGGGDIPEAVHEAIYDAAEKFPWEAGTRLILLVGDAPPHLRQRGKVSKEMMESAVSDRGIRLHSIVLPQ